MKFVWRGLPIVAVAVVIGLLMLTIPIGNSLWFENLVFSGNIEFATPTPTLNGPNCTYTIGYWKNHPKAWPVDSVELGNHAFDKNAALKILKAPVKGDASTILGKQLIAAKLNILTGTDGAVVADFIQRADNLLMWYLPGSNPSDPIRADMLIVAETLDAYNNGLIGPGHCEDDDSEDDEGGDDAFFAELPTVTPTPTPTPTPTDTPTPTVTPLPDVPTPTPTPTLTPVPATATPFPTLPPPPPEKPTETPLPPEQPTQPPPAQPTQPPEPPPPPGPHEEPTPVPL